MPAKLGNMEIFKNDSAGGMWGSKTNKTDKYLEDNYGNTYSHSMSVGHGSVTYLLNYKYHTFSGIVAFPANEESDSYKSSVTLKIYGDDEVIATFENVTDTTKPESFSLDVSKYEKITLKWICNGINIWQDWGYFATIFDGEMMPVAQKLPE